jgi:hypothetical protein
LNNAIANNPSSSTTPLNQSSKPINHKKKKRNFPQIMIDRAKIDAIIRRKCQMEYIFFLEHGDDETRIDLAKHGLRIFTNIGSMIPDDDGFNRINIEKIFIQLSINQPKQIDEVIDITHDNH